MTAFKIIMMLFGTWANCFAQSDFRFYVFDETKTDKLHYEFVQHITLYDLKSQDPRLTFFTEYRIYGINQDEFAFTTEDYAGDLSRAEFATIQGVLRKLPTHGLDEPQGHDASSNGWINLDGKNHSVSAPPDAPIRKEWQAALDGILAKYAPVEKRKISKRTIEGETVKARAIDFPTLLKSPQEFDGKRIRLTGYYHGEFEGSSFAASEKDVRNHEEALWLGGASTFADPKRISDVNDASITAEGTFEIGPGGHMGLWMGELVRLTASQQEGQDAAPVRNEHPLPAVAFPIDPSHRNPYTKIRNIILPDEEFEFAIMGTSHAGYIFGAVVVLKDGEGYRCEDRLLDVSEAVTATGKLDQARLLTLKVKTRSKKLAPATATLLGDLLQEHVQRATYTPHQEPALPCDGCPYEVYWGHMAALVYPAERGEFTDPDVISNALAQINASDDPKDHIRWSQIKAFLEAKRTGKNPSPYVPQPPGIQLDPADFPPP